MARTRRWKTAAAKLLGLTVLASVLLTATSPPGGATTAPPTTAPPTIVTTVLPAGQVGTDYLVNLQASGGTLPYFWSIPTGPIPGGLVLNSSGVLAGRPGAPGRTVMTIRVSDGTGATAMRRLAVNIAPAPLPPENLVLLTSVGRVFDFTDTAATSSVLSGAGDLVSLASNSDGTGGWALSRTGRVFAFGSVASLGSVGRKAHAGHLIGIAAAGDDKGYWIASATGQVYGFGSVKKLGSLHLHSGSRRIVAIASSPVGTGYWLVASTGQVFGFGAAANFGSAKHARIVAIAPTPSGAGYWLVSITGRVYGFGDATELGSVTSHRRGRVVAIASSPTGLGYWVISATGQVFSFGSARPLGQILGPNPASTFIAAAGSS